MPRAATAHSRVIKEAMGIKGFILAYNPFRVVDRVNIVMVADVNKKCRSMSLLYAGSNVDSRISENSELAELERKGNWPPPGAPEMVGVMIIYNCLAILKICLPI